MRALRLAALALGCLSLPALAQEPVCEPGGCAGSISGVFLCGYRDVLVETGNFCVLENCQKPQVRQLGIEEFPFTQLVVGPNQDGVTNQIRLMAEIIAPYNNFANDRDRNRNASPNGQLDVAWYRSGSGYPDGGQMPPPPWTVAPDTINSLCEDGDHDKLLTGLTHASTCAELHDAKAGDTKFRYGLRAQVCGGPCIPGLFDPVTQTCPGTWCGRWTDLEFETVFNATQLNGICPETEEAACSSGSQLGVNENGDLALEFLDSGPGAVFRYRHGGVGWPGGPEEKRDALGRVQKYWQHYSGLPRGWSHDYAKTLVKGREPGHVWLITESGTYRSFWQVGGSLRSDLSLPSDDERYLEPQLDGTIHLVDVDGGRDIFFTSDPGNPYSDAHWIGWQDANGNKKTATFAVPDATHTQMIVTMPDGRKEIFTYLIPEDSDAPKTLLSLTEVGVDGTTTRVWRYNGMSRIDMPDGRKRKLRATATGLENVLIGLDGQERIEGSWVFDEWNNVIEATGGDGSERLTFTYDKPWNPRETRVTDAYGKTTVYRFSRDPSTNRATLVEIDGACPSCGTGAEAKFRYEDPANPLLPTRIIDGKGVATEVVYDTKGQVRSVEEAVATTLARTTTIERGGPFPALVTRVESDSTSAQGSYRESIASYDAKGNPEVVSNSGIEAGGSFTSTTQAVFSPEGLPTSIDPPGNGTADAVYFDYDESRGFLLPLTRTDPLVGSTSFAYDPLNRLASVIDVNGVETTFLYDELDRLIETRRKGASAAEDLVTTFTYTNLGDLFQVVRPEGNLVEYGYDSGGRVTTIDRKPSGGTAFDRTLIIYNLAGQVERVATTSYDGASFNSGASTKYLRSSRCQLDGIEDALGKKTEFSYDCNQNLEKVWDANHSRVDFPTQPTTTYSWDVLNRLTTVSEPWAGGGTAVTRFGYDVQDHLVEVVDAEGHVTSYTWSDRDRLTSEVSEYSGTTSHRYDEAGDRVESVDARGVVAIFDRDALGRVTGIDYPESAADTQFVYDAAGSKGRLALIRRGGSQLDYRFDRFGRLIREGALTYGYDGNSRRTTIGYPNGVEARYAFDHADRPRRLTLDEPGQSATTIVADALYEAMGPLTRLKLGNGVTEERSFDGRFLPTRIEAKRGAVSLFAWTYQTDAIGNVLSITDEGDSSKSRLYGYQDFAYFLRSAEGPWGSLSWEYTKIGDRLAETRNTERTAFRETVATVDDREWKQRLIEPPGGPKTTFWFDRAGNQVFETRSNRKLAFEYGNDNRLARIALEEPSAVGSKTEFTYDGRGYLASAVKLLPSGAGWSSPAEAQRLRATYGGSTLFHRSTESLPSVLASLPAETRQADDYVLYFAGRPVAILSKATMTPWNGTPSATRTLRFLTTDHLGTPALATGENGATLWGGGFEPFGADHAGASASGVFLRFPGQWVDDTFSDSRITYNLNRWYDSRTGRYTQADPIGLAGGVNIYNYAESTPVVVFDPLGLFGLADLPDVSPEVGNFFAGYGDTLSLGATNYARKWLFGDDVVDYCSSSYTGGEVVGIGQSLVMGGAGLARNALAVGGRAGGVGTRLARGASRIFGDPRTFKTVSRQYWRSQQGGAAGRHLHHWFWRQSAGGPSAGWNLLELPGSFNSWMGYSKIWGRVAELGIRVGIPGLAAGAGYAGAEWGIELKDKRQKCGCS